jgi:hypothetical protein
MFIRDFRASLDFLLGVQGKPLRGSLNLFLRDGSDDDENNDDDVTPASLISDDDKDIAGLATCRDDKAFCGDDEDDINVTCDDETIFCGDADRRGLADVDATYVVVVVIVSSLS